MMTRPARLAVAKVEGAANETQLVGTECDRANLAGRTSRTVLLVPFVALALLGIIALLLVAAAPRLLFLQLLAHLLHVQVHRDNLIEKSQKRHVHSLADAVDL